ncbi:MAG: hypothetical protein ACJ741_04985 [Pyrinomonadaceae bacterium]
MREVRWKITMACVVLLLYVAAPAPSTAQKRKPAAKPIPKTMTVGKIGDALFDGHWHLQVLSAQTADSYAMKTDAEPYDYINLSTFDLTKRVFTPKRGNTLVVVSCRVSNGQGSPQRLWTAISDNKVHTALMDANGGSHPPIGYDFEGGPIQTQPLSPQAALDFAVVFSVPQDTKLKELLFTLRNNSTFEKGTDARVSLSTEQ